MSGWGFSEELAAEKEVFSSVKRFLLELGQTEALQSLCSQMKQREGTSDSSYQVRAWLQKAQVRLRAASLSSCEKKAI